MTHLQNDLLCVEDTAQYSLQLLLLELSLLLYVWFCWQCDAEGSMATCRRALAMSENQRETQHICLYEIGTCVLNCQIKVWDVPQMCSLCYSFLGSDSNINKIVHDGHRCLIYLQLCVQSDLALRARRKLQWPATGWC